MSLDNLNKKVNDPDELIDNSEVYGEKKLPVENNFQIKDDGKWKGLISWLDDDTSRIIKITAVILGGLLLLGAIAYGAFRYSQTAFSEDRVTIEIDGPAEINSSEIVKYKIKYKNDNRAELNNGEIIFSYPENFKLENSSNFKSQGENNIGIDIGKVKAHSEGFVEVEGRFYAPINYTLILKTALKYSPSNFNSVFQISGQKGLDVKTSPVVISIDAPREVLSENKIEYVIRYQNTSSIPFDDLNLRIDFPENFEPGNLDIPIFGGIGTWNIGRLNPGQTGETKVSGIIQGVKGDVKSIKAVIGQARQDKDLLVYDKRDAVSQVVVLPLSISQTVNGKKMLSVNSGENLQYEITYRNEGDIGLRNLIISMKIDSSILDFTKLNLGEKGSYNSDSNEIIWKTSDIPQLANLSPGQGGLISFSVPVKDKIEINNRDDKNFSIESIAKIDSPDVVYPSVGINESVSTEIVRLNSKVILGVQADRDDPHIKTSGPVPLEVGKETEYILRWSITNISNNIDDVLVSAFLPTGVKWKQEVYPESEKIDYNERTNEIVWKVGALDNGTGILNQSRDVSFKVSVVPQVNQGRIGDIVLLGKTTLRAKDLFTGVDILQEVDQKDTNLK
jgi:hypothetical protein